MLLCLFLKQCENMEMCFFRENYYTVGFYFFVTTVNGKSKTVVKKREDNKETESNYMFLTMPSSKFDQPCRH